MSRLMSLENLVLQVTRRARLVSVISETSFFAAVSLFAASVLWVVAKWFPFFGTSSFVVLCLVTGVCVGVFVIAIAWRRVSEIDALRLVDSKMMSRDQARSALWFSRQDEFSRDTLEHSFIREHVVDANQRAATINSREVVPFKYPDTLNLAILAALLFVASIYATESIVVAETVKSSQEIVRSGLTQDRSNEEVLIDKTGIEEIDQAIEAIEASDLPHQAKKEAIRKAKQAIDQINMDALLTREGISKLSQVLINQDGFQEIGEALKQGRIQEAIDMLREKQKELESAEDSQGEETNDDDQQTASIDRTEGIVNSDLGDNARDTMNEVGQPDPNNVTRLIENLEQAQQDMESQQRANTAGARMEEMGERIGAVQTSASDMGGRLSTWEDQASEASGTPSPDSGNNDMSGGSMFRKGTVTPNEKDEGDDGSSTGAPDGHAAAQAIEGRMTERLEDAILKLVKTKIEADDSEENDESAWEFQTSKKGESTTELAQQVDRAKYGVSQSMDVEFVSVERKQSVKKYFIELHEGTKE